MFALYMPLAATWRAYDNSAGLVPELIATGVGTGVSEVRDSAKWAKIESQGRL
jgi:hypothetical protein